MKVKRAIDPRMEVGLATVKTCLLRAVKAIDEGEPVGIICGVVVGGKPVGGHAAATREITKAEMGALAQSCISGSLEVLKWQEMAEEKPAPVVEKPSTSSPKTKGRAKADPKKRCARSVSARAPAKVVAAKVASSASKKKAKR